MGSGGMVTYVGCGCNKTSTSISSFDKIATVRCTFHLSNLCGFSTNVFFQKDSMPSGDFPELRDAVISFCDLKILLIQKHLQLNSTNVN